MRLLTFLAYCAFIFGAIGVFASRYYGLPKGLHLSIFVIGFGFLIGAFESVHTRRMSLRASNEAAAAYDGTPALIWGLMLFIIAGCMIGAAYLLDAGLWSTTMNHLHQRPGPLYMLGGLLLAGCGALGFVNPQGRRVWWKMLLFRTPRVLLATLFVIAGLVGVACGVWEWLEPRGFERTTHALLSKLDFRSFDGFLHSVLRLTGGNK